MAVAAESLEGDRPTDPTTLAATHGLDERVLRIWLEYLGVSPDQPAHIDGYLSTPISQAAGYDFIQGWGTGADTPNLVTNSSEQHVRIPGNMPPHSVAVHPAPTLRTAVGWRSPSDMVVRVEGQVRHAHPECGNGVTWTLELRRGTHRRRLAAGTAQGDRNVRIGPIPQLAVHPGDFVSLLIGPRDGNHACDLTSIDLNLVEQNREGRQWNLAADLSHDILTGNPHADAWGNAGVWHFYAEPVSDEHSTEQLIPPNSSLARWQVAESTEERATLGHQLQTLLSNGSPTDDDSPDAKLYRQLASFRGPLMIAARRYTTREADKTSHADAAGLPVAVEAQIETWGIDTNLFTTERAQCRPTVKA